MILYHSGFQKIIRPDIHYGRKNADFGQGFYLTPDPDFAYRWAKERKGQETIVNIYELDITNLLVHHFARNREWFEYIFSNRSGKPDTLDADLIIGPVANDTIYDTFGIITSGFLSPNVALQLLLIGPEYQQIVVKSEKAAEKLTWLSCETLSGEQLADFKTTVAREEKDYQEKFAEILVQINHENEGEK